MGIATIIVLAVTVESLIEYGKLIFGGTVNWKQIGAVVLGVALALAAQVDLFAFVGVSFVIPYIGTVLTGILFSRGANYFADFIKLIQNISAQKESDTDFRAFLMMEEEDDSEQE